MQMARTPLFSFMAQRLSPFAISSIESDVVTALEFDSYARWEMIMLTISSTICTLLISSVPCVSVDARLALNGIARGRGNHEEVLADGREPRRIHEARELDLPDLLLRAARRRIRDAAVA